MTRSAETRRELDHRTGDGLSVTLLWDPGAGQVAVAVCDSKHDEVFEIQVRPGERALDVFRHPFAYAAARVPKPAERRLAAA